MLGQAAFSDLSRSSYTPVETQPQLFARKKELRTQSDGEQDNRRLLGGTIQVRREIAIGGERERIEESKEEVDRLLEQVTGQIDTMEDVSEIAQ